MVDTGVFLEKLAYPIAIAIATAVTTWLISRNKQKQQIRSLAIENEMKSAKYYQTLVDDLALRLDNAISKIVQLEEANEKLMNVNQELIDELRKYKQLRKTPVQHES